MTAYCVRRDLFYTYWTGVSKHRGFSFSEVNASFLEVLIGSKQTARRCQEKCIFGKREIKISSEDNQSPLFKHGDDETAHLIRGSIQLKSYAAFIASL